jgi:hypothetical protein
MSKGVWVIGFHGPMGFTLKIPANQLGIMKNLWGIRGYRFAGVWDKRGSTVMSKKYSYN